MTMPPNTDERYRAISEAIAYLELPVDDLAAGIGRPALTESGRFRYSEKSVRVLQLCKLVRVVSALYGSFRLFPTGQYAEILTLLRSATDCIREIMYLHEPQQGGSATADHQRFVDHFFEEHGSTAEELIASPPRASLVERKKIHASHGRMRHVQRSVEWLAFYGRMCVNGLHLCVFSAEEQDQRGIVNPQ